MMASGIECETGRYIIYDKRISYMPNLTLTLTLNPNPNPNSRFRFRFRVRVRV